MTPEQFSQLFGLAQNEALAAFGNGEVYVEKYLEHPRHVEIQVMGDTARQGRSPGRAGLLGAAPPSEADRREPQPRAYAELRAGWGNPPWRWPPTIGYVGAGTLEFLLDPDGKFYFMEMNTRIQVEHPVTEMVTGFDIVKEQIRVASGEPVSFQGELHGASRACHRVPDQCGRPLSQLSALARPDHAYHPPGGPGVRVDTHVYAGYTVPPYYDSLLAKVIVHGRRSGGGAEPDGAGAGQLYSGRRHHHNSFSGPGHPPSRLRRGAGRHPVPRAGDSPAAAGSMRIDVLFSPAGLTSAEVRGEPSSSSTSCGPRPRCAPP